MVFPSRWIVLLVILSLISLFFFPSTSYADASWMKYFRKDSLLNTYMRAYAVDGERLWVGTWGDGVVVYTGKDTIAYNNRNTRTSPTDNDGLVSDMVTSLAIDCKNRRAWIGTNEGVASCNLEGTDWKRFSSSDGLPNDVIRDIAADEKGNVWVGTPSGVAMFDGQTWKKFDSSSGLYSDSVHSITVKGDSVWVATVDGSVNRFDGSTWQVMVHR